MPKYNPNSIWDSKKKQAVYDPPVKAGAPAAPAPVVTSSPKPPPPLRPLRAVADEEDAPKQSHAALWFVVVFAVLLLGGLLYWFLLRPPAGPNVSIGFTKPDQALVGDPFPLSISLTNYSSNILKGAMLSIILPDNVSFVGQSSGQRVVEWAIGDVGPGSIYQYNGEKTSNLIVTGGPNSIQHVDTKLIYSTDAAPKTQFETDGGADLVVGGPAISLNITPPTDVFSGQDFQTVITYNNNTSHSFNNVQLALQYPPVYSFTGSTMPPASAGNNTWNFGTIPPAGSGSFTVTGNVVGPQNATYALAGNFTGQVSGETYALTSQTANLAISSSPLSLSIALNNASNSIAHPGDELNYVITYVNNSNVTFQNMTVKAALVGAMFDLSSLQTNGSFSSITNTVTWYGANTPQLLNLAPGQSGSVSFQVRAKSSYPIRLLSDKNYTLKVSAQISSATVPSGTTASSTVSAISAENQVGGAISLAAKGYWRDAASGILNSGPYPPKVNQTTQYTLHWEITNYATDAENVTVSAYLESGTTCTGQIKSNMPTSPTCNAASGLVTWTIPTVPATTGITGPPAEAVIQVQNTPAVNQVGQSVTLLGQTTLQAVDAFTSSTLQASDGAITTDLPDDATVPSSVDRRVTQ